MIYLNSLCVSLISFELGNIALVLHLYLLEHGDGFILEKLLNSHASLILFRESPNSMVIRVGCEFSPNMMGIQDGYNKNFHIKSIKYYEKFDSL